MWMVSQCTLHLSILCNLQEFEKAFTLEPGHGMPPTDFRSLCNISPSLRTLTLIPAITKKVKKISYLVVSLSISIETTEIQHGVHFWAAGGHRATNLAISRVSLSLPMPPFFRNFSS